MFIRIDVWSFRRLGFLWFKPALRMTLFWLLAVISFNSYANVVISEFMASNDSTISDEDGDESDWIELHNNGTTEVSLNGWYLTDDDGELTKWQIPNITLNADEYLIVFTSDKERDDPSSELHTNFKLSSGGEYLALVATDGITVASEYAPEYPQQYEDVSYGDGNYFTEPTPGAANNSGVLGFVESVEFDLEHGFFTSQQILTLSSSEPGSTIRYTLDGSLPPSNTDCFAPSDGSAWSYQYYENNGTTWTSMPDFDSLTPITSSTTNSLSTDVKQRDENYGLVFNGCVDALEDGFYLFETTSDDGSQLWIDGALVVENTSSDATSTVSNEIYLEKGLHSVEVTNYQATGTSELSSQWSAPRRGQTVVLTDDNNILYLANNQSNNFIEFEFDLPSDGTFQFNAVVQGANDDSNSFWVQLNDQSLYLFEFGINAFQTVTALSATLDAGEHTLKFFPLEDGAILDSIQIVGTNCDGPCETQSIEAENQTVSGVYVFAGLDQESLHLEQ